MKKLSLLASLALGFLWSTSAQAQVCPAETWTLTPTTEDCSTSNRGRLDSNKARCALFGFAAGDTDATQCSQGQVCAFSAPGQPACPGGATCTAAQAIACGQTVENPSGRRIFPNTTIGRQQWAGLDVLRKELKRIADLHAPPPSQGSDHRVWCINFWLAASPATKIQRCQEGSLPDNCNICRDILDF